MLTTPIAFIILMRYELPVRPDLGRHAVQPRARAVHHRGERLRDAGTPPLFLVPSFSYPTVLAITHPCFLFFSSPLVLPFWGIGARHSSPRLTAGALAQAFSDQLVRLPATTDVIGQGPTSRAVLNKLAAGEVSLPAHRPGC